MTDTTTINATMAIMTFFSPYLVALLRRCTWPSEVVALVSLLVVAVLYVGGQWLDGALVWPLPRAFWFGLMGWWGLQQFSHKFVLPGVVMKKFEDVGNLPGHTKTDATEVQRVTR